MDDGRVRPVDWVTMASTQAYVLVYERACNPPASTPATTTISAGWRPTTTTTAHTTALTAATSSCTNDTSASASSTSTAGSPAI
eukprot:7390315-Prymnesium_polylepis.1